MNGFGSGLFSRRREIESVQHLSITSLDGASGGSVAPSPAVDWERTVIIVRGLTNNFASGADGDLSAASFHVAKDGTNVGFSRNGALGDGDATVYLTLVQFRPGVIKKIQRGTILNFSVSSNTATLAQAVDLARTELRFLGAKLSVNRSDCLSRVEMQDASTVKHTGANGSSAAEASYEVVERY